MTVSIGIWIVILVVVRVIEDRREGGVEGNPGSHGSEIGRRKRVDEGELEEGDTW